MTRLPEPDQTPEGPAYEGRLLDRPDDEIVDQGAAFDLRTLVSRRRVLGIAGAGAGALALTTLTPSLAAAATDTSSKWKYEAEIPEETNGPYPADGTNGVDILDNSGIVRRNVKRNLNAIATSQLAVPKRVLKKVYQHADYAGSTANLNGVGTKISDDDIFGQGNWKLEVPTFTHRPGNGYRAEIKVRVDTRTAVTSGGGGPPPSGNPPSGNPPA